MLETGDELLISAVTLAEVLVRPATKGHIALANARRSVYGLPRLQVASVDDRVAVRVASTRAAARSLGLPDAAVVATARAIGAHRVLTTDTRLAKAPEAITPKAFLKPARA
ncbi:MAG: PIN domain-containing protein [Baekduia sp.]